MSHSRNGRRGARALLRRNTAAHRRRPLALAAAAAAACLAVSACGPSVESDDGGSSTRSADQLRAPSEKSTSGEITIWDRSGDL